MEEEWTKSPESVRWPWGAPDRQEGSSGLDRPWGQAWEALKLQLCPTKAGCVYFSKQYMMVPFQIQPDSVSFHQLGTNLLLCRLEEGHHLEPGLRWPQASAGTGGRTFILRQGHRTAGKRLRGSSIWGLKALDLQMALALLSFRQPFGALAQLRPGAGAAFVSRDE